MLPFWLWLMVVDFSDLMDTTSCRYLILTFYTLLQMRFSLSCSSFILDRTFAGPDRNKCNFLCMNTDKTSSFSVILFSDYVDWCIVCKSGKYLIFFSGFFWFFFLISFTPAVKKTNQKFVQKKNNLRSDFKSKTKNFSFFFFWNHEMKLFYFEKKIQIKLMSIQLNSVHWFLLFVQKSENKTIKFNAIPFSVLLLLSLLWLQAFVEMPHSFSNI